MGDYIVLIISCIFINNIILAQYLGACPFLGTTKKDGNRGRHGLCRRICIDHGGDDHLGC
jgi:Na+-translocating ferredoxin:NAD+ oxidoreductase RnfA subunit